MNEKLEKDTSETKQSKKQSEKCGIRKLFSSSFAQLG
jgi:hypothetical protein